MGSAGVTAAPALLASTVLGYIYGTQMPAAVRSVLHPILVTALAGQAGCMLYGFVTGTPFLQALTVRAECERACCISCAHTPTR